MNMLYNILKAMLYEFNALSFYIISNNSIVIKRYLLKDFCFCINVSKMIPTLDNKVKMNIVQHDLKANIGQLTDIMSET